MSLKPLDNRILVRLDSQEDTLSNGLVLPPQAQQKSARGIVLSVGVGRLLPQDAFYLKVEDQGVAVGDRVLLTGPFAGAETGTPGEIIVDMSEVLAVYEEEEIVITEDPDFEGPLDEVAV